MLMLLDDACCGSALFLGGTSLGEIIIVARHHLGENVFDDASTLVDESFPKFEIGKGYTTCWHIYYGQKAEYLFFIDGKLSPTMKNKRKWPYQQCNDDGMEISEA
jgi:hypothetical protein